MNSIAEIIEGLRAAGFPVLDLTGCGQGLPDISVLVGARPIKMKLEAMPSTGDWFSVQNTEQAVHLAQAFEAAFCRLHQDLVITGLEAV